MKIILSDTDVGLSKLRGDTCIPTLLSPVSLTTHPTQPHPGRLSKGENHHLMWSLHRSVHKRHVILYNTITTRKCITKNSVKVYHLYNISIMKPSYAYIHHDV